MNVERIIDWLGDLCYRDTTKAQPDKRVLRAESVMKATIFLKSNEFALVREHDINGHSLQDLHKVTGISERQLQQTIGTTRNRLSKLLLSQPKQSTPPSAEENSA